MTDKPPTYHAIVRGGRKFLGTPASTYMRILEGRGLLLEREPNNPAHGNAIIVRCEEDGPLGYIEWDTADRMAPWMDKGWVFYTTCIKRCSIQRSRTPDAYIVDEDMVVKCEPIGPLSVQKKAKKRAPVDLTKIFELDDA